jgi:hypothetical protein
MNLIQKHRYVIASCLVAGATAFIGGCGASSDEAPAPEGAPGSGGAFTARGSPSAGTPRGTGGGTGVNSPWDDTAEGAGARPCAADETELAPRDGLVATFMGDEGFRTQIGAFPLDSPDAPTVSTDDGALHVVLNTKATSTPQYPTVILGFGGPGLERCIDASAFSGVEFSISGSLSGCTLQYASGDLAHQDHTSGAPRATGPAGAYQPQTTITGAELSAEPQTRKMPFVGGPSGGNPRTPIDPTKLIFLMWGFAVGSAAGGEAAACVADIVVDDVKFY